MKVVVVGLGTQGKKRIKFLTPKELIAKVDPFNKNADYKFLFDVPLKDYDTVFLCIQDDLKEQMIDYCVKNNKNILVEKPLILKNLDNLNKINKILNRKKLILYSAYNHRFEPHFITLKKIIEKKTLGKIYSCKMFYGNGTAKLVKNSPWRDKKSGVFRDLSPHLIDLCYFWFGYKNVKNFSLVTSLSHENKSPDHVVINSNFNKFYIQLEMTLCMWKNHFSCDLIGEKGSAHISSLCKWGPSTLTIRKRKIPSGVPKEKKYTLIKKDPTWKAEYQHFKKICRNKNNNDLKKDAKILENIINIEKKISL